MPHPDLNFTHVFRPPSDARSPILLMLHGTGGDEQDLLPLGRALAPGAGLLSPRGKVLEHGMPRFFRRLAEGVFDENDLRGRTHDLAAFVSAAANAYGFPKDRVIAVGFSNGANVAASLLLLEPAVLSGAVLLRAMVPLVPDPRPTLAGTPVLVSNGKLDPFVRPDQTEALVALLRNCGAEVALEWQEGGHGLSARDVSVAREWLALKNKEAHGVTLPAD